MKRTFIETELFVKQWNKLGLTDHDLFRLQNLLLYDPEAGDLMVGCGGLRKLRFAFEGRGKVEAQGFAMLISWQKKQFI